MQLSHDTHILPAHGTAKYVERFVKRISTAPLVWTGVVSDLGHPTMEMNL